MKRTFTKLMAALALLLFIAPPMVGWGQTRNVTTFIAGTDTGSTSVTKDGITVSMTTMDNASYYQTYKSSYMNVSLQDGSITSVTITCTVNGSGKYGPGGFTIVSGDPGTYTYESNGPHGTWTGNSSNVRLYASLNQVRMTEIGVTYSTSGSTGTITISDPSILVDHEEHNYEAFSGTYTSVTPNFEIQYYQSADENAPTITEPSWIETYAYKQSAGVINGYCVISANPSDERYAYFKVYSGDTYSNLITVTQSAAPTPSITITGTGITNNAITLDYNDQTAHTATVTYNNMSNPESDDVMVRLYDDDACTTYFTGGWLSANFATNSVTSINYEASANNTTAAPRTVYMRVETLNSVPCDVIAITQAGVPTYTVTYDNNGGSGTMTDPNSPYIAGATVTVLANTFTKEHYTFDKWNTKADGSGIGYVADNTFDIDENTTLYAQWTGNTHTVTLPTADTYGNYTMDKTNPVAYGTEVTLTYTPAEGYEAYSAIWSVNGTAITGNKFNMPDADVTVTVSVTEAHGTAANPYTVAEARTIINQGAPYPTGVYVSGIVSRRYNTPLSGGKISYYISDDGTQTAELEAFRGKGLNNTDFENIDDIQAGDIVVVYGNLTKWGDTYELDEGNYLYSWRRPATLTVSGLSNVETFVYNAADQNTPLLVGEGSYVFDAGDEVMISVSAESGCLLSTFTVNGVDHLNNIEADAYTFTINQNTTVTATAVQACNINYSVNGVLTQAQVPGSFQLPTSANLNSNEFVFAGWTTNPNVVTGFSTAGTIVNVQGGETFYAVYGKTIADGPATTVYQKVTSEPSSWEGEYLIVSTGTNSGTSFSVAFDGSKTSLDVAGNYIDNVIINNNVIESTSALDAATFTIAAMTGGYSIQSKSGYYIGRTANSNGMNTSNTTAIANAISMTSTLQITGTGSNTGAKLQYFSTSGSERFRYYTSSQKAIQLFKKTTVTSTTTTYYTRVFLNETATADIDIVGPSIVPSGQTLNMGTYTLSNTSSENAGNLVIEDGAQVKLAPNNGNVDVYARVLKNITGYGEGNGNWYLLSAPSHDVLNANPLHPEDCPIANLMPADQTVNDVTVHMFDLYKFDQTKEEEWQNFRNPATVSKSFIYQEGRLYARKESTTLEFGVKLATSTNEDRMYYYEGKEFAGWSLIGNAMMCNQYVALFTGYYDYETTDYYRMNAAGTALELCENGAPVAPMEGIFVQTTNSTEEVFVEFSSTPIGTKSSAIDLNVSFNNAITDRARVRFGEGSMLGKFNFNENNSKLYIPQGSKDYAVVRSNAQGEMPVNFRASKNGTYTFSVEPKNVEMTYLHLIDNKTGADVDLLATPSYTFEAGNDDYESRFRLVFKANADVEENAATETFAYFNGSEWQISNVGEATLQVIDMMGRVLSSETISGNANVTLNQAAGIYMLRLVNGENVMVQKVVVR